MRLLFNDDVIRVIASLIVAIVSGVSIRVSQIAKKNREDKILQHRQETELTQLKLSSLRGEYLSIFNSKEFTIEEKYRMTREIYQDYKQLSGNHYMDELDLKLVSKYLEDKRNKKSK